MVTGVDIVRQQLRLAAGEPLSSARTTFAVRRHAIECRINAESVTDGFLPSPGTITRWDPPTGDHVRVDSHAFAATRSRPYYDSLIAKLIVTGVDRGEAIAAALNTLDEFEIEGVETTRELHRAVLSHDDFRNDAINTRWLETTLLPSVLSTPLQRNRPLAEIDIIDQALRDGQQSLWGMRMKVARLADIAGDIEHAGYRVVDLTGSSISNA